MDSRQAFLPDALSGKCKSVPDSFVPESSTMDGFELTIHGTGYPLPGGYDELTFNLTK